MPNYGDSKVTADFYAVIVPDIRRYGKETYVYGVRVDRVRSGKPKLNKGEIPVRVKLHFDKQALVDSIPVVEANVGGFSVYQPQLEVVGE